MGFCALHFSSLSLTSWLKIGVEVDKARSSHSSPGNSRCSANIGKLKMEIEKCRMKAEGRETSDLWRNKSSNGHAA